MKIHSVRLPKTQIFCCTRRHVMEAFGADALAWVGFGWPTRSFRFDSRYRHRPKIKGVVVAALTVSRTRESYLIFYPCARVGYSIDALKQFRTHVMPAMRSWFDLQLAKPDTAVLGYESYITDWSGGSHHVHEVRYL